MQKITFSDKKHNFTSSRSKIHCFSENISQTLLLRNTYSRTGVNCVAARKLKKHRASRFAS